MSFTAYFTFDTTYSETEFTRWSFEVTVVITMNCKASGVTT
ncbi:MAG: hypothetical protein UIC64_08675 [Agathobacter sp.]|nr:hypothetical protein [Agathobacter sp.]